MRKEKSEFHDAMFDFKLVDKVGKFYLFLIMTTKRKLKKIII